MIKAEMCECVRVSNCKLMFIWENVELRKLQKKRLNLRAK